MSSRKTTRKYAAEYHNLRRAVEKLLKTEDLPYPAGSLATVLLDAFVEGDGRIFKAQLTAAGVIRDGQYPEWRMNMVRLGIIAWDRKRIGGKENFTEFTPGIAIKKYILRQQEALVVNKREFRDYTAAQAAILEEHAAKMQQHADRIAQLEDTVRTLITPPFTEEKARAALCIVQQNEGK